MASSGSSVASCPTVANVLLPRVIPLPVPSKAGEGDRAERCVSARAGRAKTKGSTPRF